MSDVVPIPGGRDVRATLDTAASDGTRSNAVVVACPPDPRQRGHRGDERLTAVSDVLAERGIDCLRFDYGDWDEGYGESTDADGAVGWAAERYERVGLFGFSFGATVALVTATARPGLACVCALAPTARLNPDVDAVAALDDLVALDVPVRVVYGTRDSTVEWDPVVDRARELGIDAVAFDSDHFFVGRAGVVADAVAAFLVPHLNDRSE